MHPWNQPLLESLLQRASRLPHAVLLHGPRGVGKLALAERIGQGLLCEHKDPAKRPCDKCDACRWFAAGNHPDFRRLEPEALRKPSENPEDEAPAKKTRPSTEIKIDQVRELAQFLNLRSHRGALRIALVHPAEALNENSQNALLKGLEEPPAGAMFLLVSHAPTRLLPTIRSRCQAVPVPVPERQGALAWLERQGAKEAARWLAYAGGAPLRALEYAANGEVLDLLIRSPGIVDAREALPPLVEAMQKAALDRAFLAFGLPAKYQTTKAAGADGRAWLRFARRLGEESLLAQHEVNPRLFSAELLFSRPKS
jgi:DNA polymerase-3 subunit delta'